MNNRTLTHNAQLEELTNALKPSPVKPAPLSSTWPVLHEKAMITAKIANEHCFMPDPPDNSMINMAAGLAVIVLTVLVLKRYGIIK